MGGVVQFAFHDEGKTPYWYGESSTAYSVWVPAMERIVKHLHEPRFILMLRHPLQRLFSHYKFFWARNLESRPLLRAVREEEEKGFNPNSPRPGVIHATYRRSSHYSYFCPVMEQMFGRENILYLNSDELSENPQRALRKCFRFLGVSEFPINREIRDNTTERIAVQRSFGLKALLKPVPRPFRDRIDPGARLRSRVKRMLAKKRPSPRVSASEKEEITRMLQEDTAFYESVSR
jgi:hypothetical protein